MLEPVYLDNTEEVPRRYVKQGRAAMLRDLLESGKPCMRFDYGDNEEASAERRRFASVINGANDLRGRFSMITNDGSLYIEVVNDGDAEDSAE